VFVNIPNCNINVVDGKPDVVPVLCSSVWFQYTDSANGGFQIKRVQVPLLPAFTFTDYKSQGRTLEHVVVDLTAACSLQSVYVMLSRAVSLKRVLVLRWFAPHKIYQVLTQDVRDEFERLQDVRQQTLEMYRAMHTESN